MRPEGSVIDKASEVRQPNRLAGSRLLHVPCEEEAADAVLKEVGDDAGAQTLAPEHKRTEHAAVDGDDHDHLPALIGVREPEEDALDESSDGCAFCEGGELALQIAAEDGFFTDAGGEGDQEIERDLCRRVGKYLLHALVVFGDAQKSAEDGEHEIGGDEEDDREADVAEDLLDVRRHLTEETGKRNVLNAETEPDEGEDEPLKKQNKKIACDARREYAEEVMPWMEEAESNPAGEQKKDAKEVPERRNELSVFLFGGCCR